jgi:hypothetical protein
MVQPRARQRKWTSSLLYGAAVAALVAGTAWRILDRPTAGLGNLLLLSSTSDAKESSSRLDTAADTNADTWPPIQVLNRVKDAKNRIVLSAVNCAYLDLADNFVTNLASLQITNYILVPLDDLAHQLLMELYPDHTVPPIPHFNRTSTVLTTYLDPTGNFGKLTSTRPSIIEAFLKQGVTVYYNDADIVWLKDVFRVYLDGHADEATILQSDREFEGQTKYCSGIIYMTPAAQNLELLRLWQTEIWEQNHWDDQNAFNAVLQKKDLLPPAFTFFTNDRAHFPPGFQIPWGPHATERNYTLLHSNFHGPKVATKRKRFERAGVWKPSGRFDVEKLELCKGTESSANA